MKRVLLSVSLCLIASTAAMPQGVQPAAKGAAAGAASTAPLPTVDQVLDKYVQAIGGKAAVTKVTSRLETGSVEMPSMSATGAVEVYAKAPNKILTIINLPGVGAVQNGFNGTIGWEKNPRAQVSEVIGSNLAALKLDAEFYGNIKLRELYPGMTLKRAKVSDRDAYVIEATPATGAARRFYFDAQTGLLVRADTERESPQGKSMSETYYDDYREVDGVKLPFTVRQVLPGFSLIFRFNDIKNNLPIDDARFNKPTS